MNIKDFNLKLSKACRARQSACCKKGLLFMTREEQRVIVDHLSLLDAQECQEFEDRCTDHGTFFLYDQKERCQFLDAEDYCRLHAKGLKPVECFWWPYHIYRASEGGFEVRVSTSCCEGYRAHDSQAPYPRWIAERSHGIGWDVIGAFRDVYKGSYEGLKVSTVPRLEVRFLGIADLPLYRSVGERLFPKANWDLGMARYEKLLAEYPEGLLGVCLGGELLAYMTLWPVKGSFRDGFIEGRYCDDEFASEQLSPPSAAGGQAWYLTAVAIMCEDRLLRTRLRVILHMHLRVRLEEVPESRVFAEVATPRGLSFLTRLGFHRVRESAEVFEAEAKDLSFFK